MGQRLTTNNNPYFSGGIYSDLVIVVAEGLVFWLNLVPALVLVVVRVNLQVDHTPLVR